MGRFDAASASDTARVLSITACCGKPVLLGDAVVEEVGVYEGETDGESEGVMVVDAVWLELGEFEGVKLGVLD